MQEEYGLKKNVQKCVPICWLMGIFESVRFVARTWTLAHNYDL